MIYKVGHDQGEYVQLLKYIISIYQLYMRQVVRWLADMRVAIFIVFVLVILSVIGSTVDQVDLASGPTTSNTSVENHNFFADIFSFDNIFSSFVFRSFACLFGISLLSCTYFQQLPSYDICRGVTFFKTSCNSFQTRFRF